MSPGGSSCEEVQGLIERRLTDVDAKMADLERVRAALADALARCRSSGKGCPVLAEIRSGGT
ncbi:MAG: MerR family DNA-binding protein, partial [Chloroflexi bacterium]|nr:MerR family DNA-binding protein [Chloroflexota bacterium]